ncbi:MAG: hypothetical protein RLZZ196_1021 [Bacteroidota bacterium]|jgi:carbamoyltransferase
MNHLGISCGHHDAGIALIDDSGNILFAAHSERYSKIKNDANLNVDIIQDCAKYLTSGLVTCSFYERPLVKATRQLYSGQQIRFSQLSTSKLIGIDLIDQIAIRGSTKCYPHHLSHASAAFQTSSFDSAVVVVIDAIGEWDTLSIWEASYDDLGYAIYSKKFSLKYPDSLGLFYSAMTKQAGFKPNEEEYILMGLSSLGKATAQKEIIRDIYDPKTNKALQNAHKGLKHRIFESTSSADLAATAQNILELALEEIIKLAKSFSNNHNLVFTGGVALNCLANRHLGKWFEHIWIPPNPGDCGSSLGAAALRYGKKLNYQNAFLGTEIPGSYPTAASVQSLMENGIVAVANGRAEWGPRALGNRSLLADPRIANIKERVNTIKGREQFRPFSPAILEEHCEKYFEMPTGFSTSPHMSVVAKCKFPDNFPGIVHYDNSSRVQTVNSKQKGLRQLLELWYEKTGCPMLLNTSLNIKGEPIINSILDANRWANLNKLQVLTQE